MYESNNDYGFNTGDESFEEFENKLFGLVASKKFNKLLGVTITNLLLMFLTFLSNVTVRYFGNSIEDETLDLSNENISNYALYFSFLNIVFCFILLYTIVRFRKTINFNINAEIDFNMLITLSLLNMILSFMNNGSIFIILSMAIFILVFVVKFEVNKIKSGNLF